MKRHRIFLLLVLITFCFMNCKKESDPDYFYNNLPGKWVYYKIGDIDGPLEFYQHAAGCSKDWIEFTWPFWVQEYIFDQACNRLYENKLGKGVAGQWQITEGDMLTRQYGDGGLGRGPGIHYGNAYTDKNGNLRFADPDYYQIMELNKNMLKLHRMGEGKIQVIIFQKM